MPGGVKPRNRRLRLILAMGAGILALFCVGGVGVVIALYDEATAIDRSEPDVVANSFLIAYTVNRDDKEAQLFTCASPNLAGIKPLRDEIATRESKPGIRVSVSWGALTRTRAGEGREDVSTQLTISGTANGQPLSSRNENWRLTVVDEGNGWRVCDAAKTP